MEKSSLLPLISAYIILFTISSASARTELSNYPLSILITEILYDPDPAIGLPGCEYIELYNNSPDTINMANWIMKVGEKEVRIPGTKILPWSFAVLLPDNCTGSFEDPEINIILIDKWAALRNGGQDLTLLSAEGSIIHFVSYHPLMFDDPLKRDGGWSLELADLNSPCNQAAWLQSDDLKGGTPGRPNSRTIQSEDKKAPRVVRGGLPDLNRLIIYFDEPLLPFHHSGWLDFDAGQGCPPIAGWAYYHDRPDKVQLLLDGFIPNGQVFKVGVSGEATDCNGNRITGGPVEFGAPENPLPGDVLISELMFDPHEGREEFIEIYNYSEKVLALNDLYIATTDDKGQVKAFSKPSSESFLMFPGRYYVITPDGFTMGMSDLLPIGNVCQREDLPSLSNEGSGILIMDRSQVVLDSARYDPVWFDSRLGDSKGISLERLRFDLNGTAYYNWHPASLLSGGSTPGLPNSQQSEGSASDEIFWLEARAFCPGRDIYPSYLLINAKPTEAGWIGKALVLDIAGNKIKDLSGLTSLPSGGAFKWDGSDENGRRVPPGYYIIIINYIRPDGSKGRWKDACLIPGY